MYCDWLWQLIRFKLIIMAYQQQQQQQQQKKKKKKKRLLWTFDLTKHMLLYNGNGMCSLFIVLFLASD